MGTDRTVSLLTLATLLLTLAACSDGGPPGPFARPRMRGAPTIAADSGTPQSDDDAGELSSGEED